MAPRIDVVLTSRLGVDDGETTGNFVVLCLWFVLMANVLALSKSGCVVPEFSSFHCNRRLDAVKIWIISVKLRNVLFPGDRWYL